MGTVHEHEVSDVRCPTCSSLLRCTVEDRVASDYYLIFSHACGRCCVLETQEIVIWSASPDEAGFVCPMCGFDNAPNFIGGA